MNRTQFYICAAIFLALTALRFTSPALADRVSDGISRAINMEQEQTETVIELGKSLADGDVLETFLERFEKNFQAEPVSAVVSAEPTASQAPPPTQSPTPEATAHPTPEPTIHPAVAVFMEAQSAYSAYAVPETVSYERPELPFEYSSPVAGVTSSGFGYRMHPIKNEVKYHYGTDLAANTGTPITAFADGSIVAQGDSDSFGKYVMIDHPDGYRTLYAHCSKLCMNCGAVKKGDTIALVGSTGAATGPHLHFELEHNGVYLNPEFYI